jgi:hypothetical protein
MPQPLLPTHSAGEDPQGLGIVRVCLDGRLWCRPEAGCGTGTDSGDHVAVDTHDQPGSPCPGRERETCCSSCQPAGSKRAALAVRSDRCRPPASIKDHDVAQVASTVSTCGFFTICHRLEPSWRTGRGVARGFHTAEARRVRKYVHAARRYSCRRPPSRSRRCTWAG